jgi:hypothetical protein
VSEYCKDNYLGAGVGFNNGIIASFTAFTAPLIGELITFFSHHAPPSIFAFQKAFSVIFLFVAVAIILSLFFIEETYCKSQKVPMKLQVN